MSRFNWKTIMGEHPEPNKPKPHKGQKKITIDGYSFYADKKLIPLLKELNKQGLITYSHCAGHSEHNSSWIVFDMESIQNLEIRTGHTGRK